MGASIASERVAISLTLDDNLSAHADEGHEGPHRGAECKVSELGYRLCVISLNPRLFVNGQPETNVKFPSLVITPNVRKILSDLARSALALALKAPAELAAFAIGFKESLFSIVDAAISGSRSCEVEMAADKNFDLVCKIDAYLLDHVSEPIYSDDLAGSIGVSVRTLHTAIVRYSGLSLHRYLRHKRLLLVRQQLIAGGQSIKACALAHGFWHMGDFTRAYRAQFGETPSQTLALKRTAATSSTTRF